jgi:hypothetical protein
MRLTGNVVRNEEWVSALDSDPPGQVESTCQRGGLARSAPDGSTPSPRAGFNTSRKDETRRTKANDISHLDHDDAVKF